MKRRNADIGKLRRPVKRTKISEGMYGNSLLYLKFVMLWASIVVVDYMLEFRFEFLWPFWMMLRSVYDSFKYQGLAFSMFFICIALTSDMICFFFIPLQYIFFAASTYVWVQYVWYTLAEKGICLPTVAICCVVVYIEGAIRGERGSSDLCRPLAAHCVGYPAVTLGFTVKSYVGHRLRLRQQRKVREQNETYFKLLRDALPPVAESPPAADHIEQTTHSCKEADRSAESHKEGSISVGNSAPDAKHANGSVKRKFGRPEPNGHCTVEHSQLHFKLDKLEKHLAQQMAARERDKSTHGHTQTSTQASSQAYTHAGVQTNAHAHTNGTPAGATHHDDEDHKHDHYRGGIRSSRWEKKDAITLKEEKRRNRYKDKENADSHRSTEHIKEQLFKDKDVESIKESVKYKECFKEKEREKEAKEREKEAKEREKEVKEREKELKEREKEAKEREREAKEREREAKEREKETKEREKEIKEREKETKEREKETKEREKETKEREKETKEKEKEAKEREKETKEREKEIKEREKETKEREKETKEREKEKERERDRERELQSARECAEELRQARAELAAARAGEAEARRALAAHAAADAQRRNDHNQLKQAHATLQHKVSTWRSSEKASLERRLGEERRARTAAESLLQRARTQPAKPLSGECDGEWCKSRRVALEGELSALRRDLQRSSDAAAQLQVDVLQLTEQVRRSESGSPDTPLSPANGWQTLQERAAHLERALSTETRFKLELLSALGEARRKIHIQEDVISKQVKEIEELKAQMLAVMPTEFVTPGSGTVSKLRLADGSPLDPNATVYTPKQLCSDA